MERKLIKKIKNISIKIIDGLQNKIREAVEKRNSMRNYEFFKMIILCCLLNQSFINQQLTNVF